MAEPVWRPLGRFGLYVWPLRVPVVSAAFLLGLPWFAFWPAVRPFLAGIFDPVNDKAISIITALALFNAWTIAVVSRLILAYGGERLDLPRTSWRFFPTPRWIWVASALLAVPVVGRVFMYSHRSSDQSRILGLLVYAACGAAVAVAMLAIALRVSDWLDARSRRLRRPGAGSALERAYARFLGVLREWPSIGAGFLVPDPERRRPPELARGHGLAFCLALLSLFLYLGTGFVTRNVQRPVLASTLAYILLLALVLTWLLAVAAFLFDRSRVPLTAFFLVWIVIVNTVIHRVFPTDHVYRTAVVSASPPPRAAPSELLRGADPAIVVAASGGGIQAAAWTARVLTGLDGVAGFKERLRFISAVSGGSVGTMNVLAGWSECGPSQGPGQVHHGNFEPNRASRESSLHAVGWGLVFKDLPRTMLPFFSSPLIDRGSVLEDAWKREARLQKPFPDPSPLLSSWRRNVQSRSCPGVVYNAMAAETGEPILFSTVGLPPELKPFDFYERYPGRDLAVVTAVRLSAGFPYVSPAAHADADVEDGHFTHVVDGGYFDNYGVSTLTAWMNDALRGLTAPAVAPRHLLVIEICESAACSGHEPPDEPSAGGEERAWPYQLVAPLSALVATRAAAQRVNNRTVLRLLKDYWRAQETCVES
ncbi:MAG: hypothetical protein ACRD15_11640, partial [Vicinamibacterales bacterium]